MLDSAEINGHSESFADIFQMVLSALDAGWDEQYGGILHFASVRGGEPDGDNSGFETEPMSVQLSGWGDKLWWPHSEALSLIQMDASVSPGNSGGGQLCLQHLPQYRPEYKRMGTDPRAQRRRLREVRRAAGKGSVPRNEKPNLDNRAAV